MMNREYWANLNIDVKPAYKNFYGKYLYRVELRVPCCHDVIIPYKKGITGSKLVHEITHRNLWRLSLLEKTKFAFKNEDQYSVNRLLALGTLVSAHPQIKCRVEDPRVSFYFETEQQAMLFVDSVPAILKTTPITISGPIDQESRAIITDGYVIQRRPSDYRYLVTLPEGRYPFEDTRRLLAFLLSAEAKVTALLKSRLSGDYFGEGLQTWRTHGQIDDRSAYFYNIRFYLKSESDISWLHLLWGRRSVKIQEVRCLEVNIDKE